MRGLEMCQGRAAPPESHRMGWKDLRDQPVPATEPWAGTPPARDGLCLLLGRFPRSVMVGDLPLLQAPVKGEREPSAFWKDTYFQPNKRRTKMIKFSMVKTQ